VKVGIRILVSGLNTHKDLRICLRGKKTTIVFLKGTHILQVTCIAKELRLLQAQYGRDDVELACYGFVFD
jgi:hypothetical protein